VVNVDTRFASWLITELLRRGWTQSELARRSEGVSRPTISNILASGHEPSWDFCNSIAHGLGIPPGVVFREAGLLTGPGLEDATARQILDTLDAMSEEDRLEVLAYAQHRYSRGRDK
jgi:transcriptional regulator with XRE-family HTH domain